MRRSSECERMWPLQKPTRPLRAALCLYAFTILVPWQSPAPPRSEHRAGPGLCAGATPPRPDECPQASAVLCLQARQFTVHKYVRLGHTDTAQLKPKIHAARLDLPYLEPKQHRGKADGARVVHVPAPSGGKTRCTPVNTSTTCMEHCCCAWWVKPDRMLCTMSNLH